MGLIDEPLLGLVGDGDIGVRISTDISTQIESLATVISTDISTQSETLASAISTQFANRHII